jgi:hypothetical protein
MVDREEQLLSREDAAAFLGVTKGTLEVWASTGRYKLPVVKIGRLAKYRYSDLLSFIQLRTLYDGRNELPFEKGDSGNE